MTDNRDFVRVLACLYRLRPLCCWTVSVLSICLLVGPNLLLLRVYRLTASIRGGIHDKGLSLEPRNAIRTSPTTDAFLRFTGHNALTFFTLTL